MKPNSPTPPRVKLLTEILGIFRSLIETRKNVLSIIPELATKQPIVSGKTAWVRWHMVMDPDSIRNIMRDKLDIYPKSDVTKNLLEPAIGNSMFIAEGAHWRWQRRAAAPVFSHRNIANLTPIMTAAAEASVERLAACDGQADIMDEMVSATFDVISSVTFSGDDTFESAEVHAAIDAYINQIAKVSLFDILGVPSWVPRPSRMFQPNTLKKTKRLADEAIGRRKKTGSGAIPDLLDLLMEGEDPETKRQMNAAELRDNLLTFIVAGHETTALTLSWALYLCAFDPDVQDRLRVEVQGVLNGRAATMDDVDSLPYCEQVIKEALRLYPPAAFISRTALGADMLQDREVRKGDTVMLPIYALHRHHLLWENPDHFDPDRFAPGIEHDRFAYIPFGDGPRVCIGAHFAMVEAKIILATLISKFKFERIPGQDPKPVMILTLRPEGGMPLKVTPV